MPASCRPCGSVGSGDARGDRTVNLRKHTHSRAQEDWLEVGTLGVPWGSRGVLWVPPTIPSPVQCLQEACARLVVFKICRHWVRMRSGASAAHPAAWSAGSWSRMPTPCNPCPRSTPAAPRVLPLACHYACHCACYARPHSLQCHVSGAHWLLRHPPGCYCCSRCFCYCWSRGWALCAATWPARKRPRGRRGPLAATATVTVTATGPVTGTVTGTVIVTVTVAVMGAVALSWKEETAAELPG